MTKKPRENPRGKRPFANARDMDGTMMTAWKSVVGTDDTVLNGGDVALAAGQPPSRRGPMRATLTGRTVGRP